MKRVIKDYNAITEEQAALIQEKFPNGFENEHLVSFTTPKGEYIKALEIRTEDTIYLFKIDKNMSVAEDENAETDNDVSDFDGFKGGEGSEEDDEDDDADDNMDEAEEIADDGDDD
jgi:DNA-directed RNA polymerase subunit delta